MKNLLTKIILILSLISQVPILGNTCCNTEKKSESSESSDAISSRKIQKNSKCKPVCSNSCYCCGITTFIPRSQGANTARELITWQNLLHRNYDQNYAVLDVAIEVTRSFKSSRIAKTLFCTDCLTFAGSQVSGRNNQQDVVADYFGLSTEFKTTLKIEPVIENHIVDLNCFFGLNNWFHGAYFRLHAPITHTKWNLGLDDCVVCDNKSKGDETFPPGYMQSFKGSVDICSDNDTCNNETESDIGFEAQTTNSIKEALSGYYLFGDMQTPWNYGKFSFCPRSKVGIADIDAIFGLDFIQNEYANLGLYGQVVIPTGTRPKAKYIFEPILGNGKHWELGLGFSGHISLFKENRTNRFNVALYVEGNATHMFKTDQKRSFDFKNGQLSRYLLLKEFDKDFNYNGNLINGINFTTRNCEVKIDYKVDFSAKLAIDFCNWTTDFGYNIYARAKEKIKIETDCPCDIDYKIFGIKGTEGVVALDYDLTGINYVFNANETACSKLNNTQNIATIFNAQVPTGTDTTTGAQNPNTPISLNYNSPNLTSSIPINNGTDIILAQNTAAEIINCKKLDPNSAAQCSALTHKFFVNLSHDWRCNCYEPHISLGGEVEFDGKKIHNSLNQWGIWIKGGISF